MELEDLKKQLEKLEKALGESRARELEALQENKRLEEDSKKKIPQVQDAADTSSPSPSPRELTPVFITSRQLTRFRDRPKTSSDPTVYEWVSDMRAHLGGQRLSKEQQSSIVMEHLSGRARLEVQSRAIDIQKGPEEMFATLKKVFGDGDSLGQLMSQFYAYQQKAEDDLLATSFSLLSLFRRMCDYDKSLNDNKDRILKDRLAEAVTDEGLRREIRRLNVEMSSLSFLEVRDRAIHWMGNTQKVQPRRTTVQEHPATVDPILEMLKAQGELMKTLADEVKSLKRRPTQQRSGERLCFKCQKPGHIARNCPPQATASAPQQAGTPQPAAAPSSENSVKG